MADVQNERTGESHRFLDPSELGTKEYWETAYSREIDNYRQDAEDEGTVWFSESSAEETVQRHLSLFEERGLLARDCRFLDLGTGNGHMLFALREDDDDGETWSGEMVGVDYSPSSVRLAQRIAVQRQEISGAQVADDVKFELWDMLSERPGDWLGDGFDVVLDKGTFDAISLMPRPAQGPHPCEVYRETVLPLIKPGCYLFITSCNWTRDELVGWLASDPSLTLFDEAKYPTFTFGGRTGQSVVTVVFQRRVS